MSKNKSAEPPIEPPIVISVSSVKAIIADKKMAVAQLYEQHATLQTALDENMESIKLTKASIYALERLLDA